MNPVLTITGFLHSPDNMSDFKIDLQKIKKETTVENPEVLKKIDAIADGLGFSARGIKKRRGRSPSPRTGQIHAKVLPFVAEEISNEAKLRGVQQGVILEEAWDLYKQKNKI